MTHIRLRFTWSSVLGLENFWIESMKEKGIDRAGLTLAGRSSGEMKFSTEDLLPIYELTGA